MKLALLDTLTVEETANLCNCSIKTVHRCLADPVFNQEVENDRRQQSQDAVSLVRHESKNLVRRLFNIAYNPMVPFASQVTAIRVALQFMNENDLAEIRESISRLDKQRTIDQSAEWK
jgi:hypothetical protein